jgi:integrase
MRPDEYLLWAGGSLKPSSLKTYQRVIAVLRSLTGGVYSVENLRRYADALRDRYAPGNVKHHLTVAKTFLKKTGGPWQLLPRAPRREFRRYIVTAEDQAAMLALVDQRHAREIQVAIALRLLWDTGCRVGELVSIPLQDSYGGKATLHTLKTDQLRTLFWTEETDALIRRWLPIRRHIARGDALLVPTDRWGKSRGEDRLSTRAVERWVANLRDRIGLDGGLTCHSYRHRFAQTRLANLNPYQVATLTGHKHIASLEHYTRYDSPEVEAFARRAMG